MQKAYMLFCLDTFKPKRDPNLICDVYMSHYFFVELSGSMYNSFQSKSPKRLKHPKYPANPKACCSVTT